MAVISISEAARTWRMARSTLQRAIHEGRLSATVRANGSKGVDTAELIRVFGDAPGARQERGSSDVPHATGSATPIAADSTIAALQAQVKLLQEQLQEARQREAWLQSIIEQRLLPPPHQGIIEQIGEMIAWLRGPKGSG